MNLVSEQQVTPSGRAAMDVPWGLVGVVALATVLFASWTLTAVPGEWLTRNTIRLAVAWYAAALMLMIRMQASDWQASSPLGRASRWCWTWGLICFLLHVAMAFHFYHHWSHAHAFERTRQASGIGEGIFASYAFTAVWTADVVWWWLGPNRYAARGTWTHRGVHLAMLFIIFNGTVVFEDGVIRWASLAAFSVLAALWLVSRGRASLFHG